MQNQTDSKGEGGKLNDDTPEQQHKTPSESHDALQRSSTPPVGEPIEAVSSTKPASKSHSHRVAGSGKVGG